MLSGSDYVVYWNFDIKKTTIEFAVDVDTTGWIGFGLSLNGQMPGSDVVIGWVKNDTRAEFHVQQTTCNS